MTNSPLTMLEIADLRAVYVSAFHKAPNETEKDAWRNRIRELRQQEALIVVGETQAAALQLSAVVAGLEGAVIRLQDPSILLQFRQLRTRVVAAAGISAPSQPIPWSPLPIGQPISHLDKDAVPPPQLPPGAVSTGTPPSTGGPTPVPSAPSSSHTAVDRDLLKLHPTVRAKVSAVQAQLDAETIPMRVFEAYRSPERQAVLYAQGRTTGGDRVTNAQSWESYHQYGLAADFVRFEAGGWNWDTDTKQKRDQWARFHDIARSQGLEPLSWEKPHVQLVGWSFTRLLNGEYPDGGDDSWSAALTAAIDRWGGTKPPPPRSGLRPAQPDAPMPAVSDGFGSGAWRNQFGGDFWYHDRTGVYTRNPDGSNKLWRTPGSPTTVQEIIALYGGIIADAGKRFGVEPVLIVMTIATEAAAYRADRFTGPRTFRWEPDYLLRFTGDSTVDGSRRGDYSAGPMQVLSDTARWINHTKQLAYDAATLLPWYKSKPSAPSANLGLMDPTIAINVGAAYIASQLPVTGGDPLLVAAAYNAGSLKPSAANHWRIHSTGNHLDRAAEWYGDACAVLNQTA